MGKKTTFLIERNRIQYLHGKIREHLLGPWQGAPGAEAAGRRAAYLDVLGFLEEAIAYADEGASTNAIKDQETGEQVVLSDAELNKLDFFVGRMTKEQTRN